MSKKLKIVNAPKLTAFLIYEKAVLIF